MTKDHRLELDRYLDYGKDLFVKKRNLNFDDLFSVKSNSGAPPWNLNRFDSTDLLRRVQTKKLIQNPGLQQVGEEPTEVFSGIGRFDRNKDYDFMNGRAKTNQRPEEQPGFTQTWGEFYSLSPTMDPGKRISNPMPRAKNPDPKGYIMAQMEQKVENEAEGNMSVAQLMSDKDSEDDKA
jgi:hypothetical protein